MDSKYLYLIIAGLIVIIILLSKCNLEQGETVIYSTTSDTVYIEHDTTIVRDFDHHHYHTDTVRQAGDTVFVADTTFAGIKAQYEELVKLYSARNIYLDTILVDTFGTVYIRDTIQYNKIDKRIFDVSYSIPLVTVKEISEPKNLFYAGGGLMMAGSKFSHLYGGVLYKPKKHIFGVHVGVQPDGTILYGGSAHFLLNKFKIK